MSNLKNKIRIKWEKWENSSVYGITIHDERRRRTEFLNFFIPGSGAPHLILDGIKNEDLHVPEITESKMEENEKLVRKLPQWH